MIVLSPALVLAPQATTTLLWPHIGWENLVTIETIAADHEDTNYPATNLANPQTNSLWKSGSTADGSITITLSGEEQTNYVGIARHNLGSGLVPVTIYGTVAGGDPEIIVGPQYLGDDLPAMFVFAADFYTEIEIFLEPAAVAPQAAVVYVGKALAMPTGIPPGHTPTRDALETQASAELSENGEFVGDIIVSQRFVTSIDFRMLDGAFYREHVRPFIQQRDPFFFAWCPLLLPTECAYAKFNGNPRATINQATGEFDLSFGITGLAK
jgi:hypothetical protein